MTLRPSPKLAALRREAQSAVRANADVMFRHALTFTLGPHEWEVRCSVRDPQRMDPKVLARMQQLTSTQGLATSDLRLLTVHPEDTVPFPGATTDWDDGTLEVLEWSQASDFTSQRLGTCVLRRP